MVKVPYLVKGNQLVMERLMGKLYNLVYLLLLALPVKSAAIDTPPPSGTITDSRDGRQYHWIRIGEQKWLTENMAFGLKESYPKCELCDVNDGTANNEDITKHDYIENYGRLYPWESALSVCPDGWRLPTIEEWQQAIEAHGPLYLSGRKMSKNAAELSSWGNWNGYASNDLGFSVLPAGRIEVSWDNFINYMKGFADLKLLTKTKLSGALPKRTGSSQSRTTVTRLRFNGERYYILESGLSDKRDWQHGERWWKP